MISGTVTDASGRILSGQTVEAFWNSVRHARPLSVGLNCALGAALMRPYIEELAAKADVFVSVYPNAGLPNPMSETGFDETPDITSSLLREFADAGFVNIAGGCCGTTPEHIRRTPDPVKITFPLMAIACDDRYIGLIWEPSDTTAAAFDSPDRIYHSGGHVMALSVATDGSSRPRGRRRRRASGPAWQL